MNIKNFKYRKFSLIRAIKNQGNFLNFGKNISITSLIEFIYAITNYLF